LSGSNFYDPQFIGPPLRAIGPINARVERIEKLYIWLVQINSEDNVNDASAAAEIGPLDAAYLEKTKVMDQKMFDVVLEVESGPFQEGPAFAFATAIVRDSRFPDKNRVIAWTDSVVMKPGDPPFNPPPPVDAAPAAAKVTK